MISQKFQNIFYIANEELYEKGPEQKALMKVMKTSLDHNLKITQAQFSSARRGLVEEQMKFKNFDNYKKKDKPRQLEEKPSEDEHSVQPVDEPVKKDKKVVKN